MKSRKAFAAIAVFLMLSPGSLFADCPTISSQGCCGGYTWKWYSFTLDCATVSAGGVPDHAAGGHGIAGDSTAHG
jgi:hypothetical protein